MAHLFRRLNKKLQPASRYGPSWVGGLRRSDLFDAVERFCIFVGYPRSGHSLVGSLLDAHPDVVLAHELDALRYLAAGYRRDQLYWLILKRDAEFTRAGRRWTEFDYAVPGQWQGRFANLRILGDKKGGASTARLAQRPELLDRLEEVVDGNVNLIHVVRNPFDNIATMSRRTHRTLEESTERYFGLCATIQGIRSRAKPGQVIDLRHEALIDDPDVFLGSVCERLGLSVDQEYLKACAAVLFPSPHLSRLEVAWDGDLARTVHQRIGDFDFLDGYSFEDR